MSEKTVIYGATGGMGESIARGLPQGSTHLVGRDPGATEKLAMELGASFSVADVLDPEAFPRVGEEVQGDLSGLVYAVGSIRLKPLARLSAEEVLEDFRLNALGAMLAVQSLTRRFKPKGSVVLFSSVAVSSGFPQHASIALAKGGVEGLTRSLAAELSPRVRVNAIAPSLTRTPLASSLLQNESMATGIAKAHPLGRLGEAEDAAALAQFLLSDASSWITGQVIGLDGGRGSIAGK